MSIQLYQGDCLEIMKQIPNESINMICCDLPFGTTRNAWDCTISLEELWLQYNRIAKENCAIVLFAQSPFDKVLGCSNLSQLRYEWIWEKDSGTGFLNAKRSPLKIHENILVFYKKPPIYNPQMRSGKPYKCKQGKNQSNSYDVMHMQDNITTINNGERYPIDVIKFSRDKENRLHPTQKPVALIEYLIRTYTNEGDVVLDNCMGSGTCGVACTHLNRKFIGIEKDEHYFEVAKERINNSQVGDLF